MFSTAVFGLQVFCLLIGSLVFNWEITTNLFYASGAALLLAVVDIFRDTKKSIVFSLVSFAAVLGGGFLLALQADRLLMSSIIGALILIVSTIVATSLESNRLEEGKECEPLPTLWLAALPLGIGAVFGGLIYFFAYREKRCETEPT